MKQINNGFDACYYLTEDARLYNNITKSYIKPNGNSYAIMTAEGKRKKISIKKLYKLVYNKIFCEDSIEDIEGEEWKEIEGTENKYYISNKGRVKSKAGYNAIILQQYITDKGYAKVTITQYGERCCKLVSRLVAAAFLLPPESIEYELHHINGTLDNSADSLVWLHPKEHRELHLKLRENKRSEKHE